MSAFQLMNEFYVGVIFMVLGLFNGVWIVESSRYPLMDWVLVPYTQQNLTWTQHGFDEKIGEIQKVAKEAGSLFTWIFSLILFMKMLSLKLLILVCLFFTNLVRFIFYVLDFNVYWSDWKWILCSINYFA